ncbi:MAG TPA: penicillin acylase family protein [Labilithrix sp.]|nr:penicillin acylase family protein [Labilithrix sp.]
MKVVGPWGPVLVERDALGYPTIHARDLAEATWVRGYMHATDRLVQVQLMLAAARGELLSMFGEKRFARTVDRAVRGLGLVTDLDTQVRKLQPETRAWFETYCNGFNAGAAKRGTPSILRLLGRQVEPFTPRSILTIYRLVAFFGLTSMQQTAEMIVAELVASGAPREAFTTLLGDAAEGLDLEELRELRVPPEIALLAGSPVGGSNGFAIAGSVSSSKGALLMGEFHMEVGRFPPVVYASHVVYADGSYYQGLGIPGFAWNSCGRTDHVAFTCTFGHADNVDIVAERCKDGKHLVGDEWRPLTRRVERVRVRGRRELEEWTFYDGEYGTVLGDAAIEGVYPCMRWSGFGDLANDGDVVLASLSAKNVDECIAIFRRFRMLSTQQVVADSAGAVGEAHCGQTDVRPDGWSGAYPYAGWKLPDRSPPANDAQRPASSCASSRVAAANHRPPGEDGKRWVTLPEPHDRIDRLEALLADVTDLDGMVRVSYDAFDGSATRLLAVWGPLLPDDPEVRALLAWAPEQRDRSQLGLFYALHEEATRALLARSMGAPKAARIIDDLGASLLFQFHTDRVLALEVPAVLDREALRDLLAGAWSRAKTGPGRAAFPIVRRFADVLTQGKLGSALGLCSAKVTFPGAPCAPFQTRTVRFEGESMVFGPAFHYVTDMSQRGGWYHVPGGASERRTGPGYGKGVDLWSEGRFLPMGDASGRAPRA